MLQYHTGLKVLLLIVRRDISSTFGLNTASCALFPARFRRLSQGESWVWLNENESFFENARPKVKPSNLRIFASEQGSYTLFVSAASPTNTIITINNMAMIILIFTIVVFSMMNRSWSPSAPIQLKQNEKKCWWDWYKRISRTFLVVNTMCPCCLIIQCS